VSAGRRGLAVASILLLCVAACRKADKPGASGEPPPGATTSHEGEGAHDAVPTRAKLTREVVESAKIRTEPVAKEVLAPTLSLPGEISADPDRSARVSTPVAGRVVEVRFREGSVVKKGDVLVSLRIPEIGKVRAAHSATVAKSASARSNADRLGALAEKGMAPRQEALAARAEADALEAESKALGEQLQALGMGTSGAGSELSLRAPVGGTVVSRDAVVGQPVGTDDTLASIADLSEVWFLARVFEKDLGRLDVDAPVEVTLNAYPSERWPGTVEYVGKQIDPIARTVNARVRLTNRDEHLRLGLFGTARVVVKGAGAAAGDGGAATSEPVLVVPRSALSEIGGRSVVFVRVGEGEFETHVVTLGEAAAGRVRVLGGLREGELVVVDGAFTVKSVLLRGSLAGED
jgi:membrane fusion protein, heavy metal efflux system